jgi:hypothetical protein
LPPEDGTGRGIGSVSYTIRPRAGLTTGAQIHNVASVKFDANKPIATDLVDENNPSLGIDPNKQALNTIDAGLVTFSNHVVRVDGSRGPDKIVLYPNNGNLEVIVNGMVLSSTLPLTSIQQIQVFGHEGDDALTVSGLAVPMSIDGGDGINTLTINASALNNTFLLGSNSVSVNGAPFALAGLAKLTLNGPMSKDSLIVQSVPAFPVEFNGGLGVNKLQGPDLANSWTITNANAGTLDGSIRFSNVQNLTGGSGDDSFRFAGHSAALSGSIDGKAGSNTLDLSGRTAAVTVTLLTTGLNKATGLGGTFVNIGALVGSAATTDTLIGPNAPTTWTISGTNAGSVGGIAFTGFENLTGGSAADTFAFTGTGNVTGNVNGGGGANVLDLSGYSSPATLNLQTKKATPIGGTFSGIGALMGSTATTETLTGANASNAWSITGANAGTVNGFTFTSIGNLVGGSGVDVFTFSSAGQVASLDGGGAPPHRGDWLDYTSFTTAVTVNLATGSTTNVNGGAAGSVTNIQNVHGGNGGNTLTGNAQGNILIAGTGTNTIAGGSGRSLLIADTGASMIMGGSGGSASGGDILIAGSTTYDTMTAANEAALMSILAEWQSADSNSARFARINTGNGGGLNGRNKLNYGTTALDNGKVNTLTGQPGLAVLDWFFANTVTGHTIINNFETGERLNNS